MPTSKRDNARGQAGVVSEPNSSQRFDSISSNLFPESLPEPVGAKHSHFTTTGEAQRRRILEMLRTGRQSTLDFRRAGIMQSQTRIFELRSQGYDIPTVGRVTAYDDQGYPHCGVALYELFAEPEASIREAQP